MGREGRRAKTKTVMKPVKQWEQLGSMQNWKFQTFGNKNPPTPQAGLWFLSARNSVSETRYPVMVTVVTTPTPTVLVPTGGV